MTSDNLIKSGSEQEARLGDSDGALSAASDPALGEDLALALIKRHDLGREVLERLSKNAHVIKSRKVQLALVQHPKTPRHIARRLLRHLFTFELMQVTLNPAALSDMKKAAEESLIGRLESVSLGEKLTLARRAPGNVAGELLLDPEPRVVQAALENSRLTEASLVRAILRGNASPALVRATCLHPQWSLREKVRIALLRNQHTPPARALEFARTLPDTLVTEILRSSSLPEGVKTALQAALLA